MVHRSTVEYVARLVIRQVLEEFDGTIPLAEALERAYPLGENPRDREVWKDALIYNAIDPKSDPKSASAQYCPLN